MLPLITLFLPSETVSIREIAMSLSTSFETLWVEAIDRYLLSTNRTYSDQILLKGLRNTDDLHTHLHRDCCGITPV